MARDREKRAKRSGRQILELLWGKPGTCTWAALSERSELRRDKSIFWPLQFLDPQSWLLDLDPELCEYLQYLNLKPVNLNPWSWILTSWSWILNLVILIHWHWLTEVYECLAAVSVVPMGGGWLWGEEIREGKGPAAIGPVWPGTLIIYGTLIIQGVLFNWYPLKS